MENACDSAGQFLQSVFESTGLSLDVTVKQSPTECLLDLGGEDTELLQAEGGELLQALQHLVTQAYGRKLPEGQRLFCDVEGFRATREAELRAMANHAAERVRPTGVPFVFGERNSIERQLINLTLAEQEEIFTESIGDEAVRKFQVVKKPSA